MFDLFISRLLSCRSSRPLAPAWAKLLIFTHGTDRECSGVGRRVQDVICTFGPHDRPFAERHHGVCVAAVTEETFQYRSTLGSAVLAPGALLLGNDRHAFECRHEHGTGDRCLSFRLTPEFLEGVVAAIPGVRRAVFSAPLLPPQSGLLPIIAAAEAAREDGDAAAFEEVALRLAGAVAAVLAGTKGWTPAPSRCRSPIWRARRR